MPYAALSDLPEPVRKALPEHGQEIYLAAFNSAFSGTCKGKEDCANAVAWSAVKNQYKKTDKGDWQRIENLFSDPHPITSVHNVTIQRLDVPHLNNGRQVIYPVDQFRANLNAWSGIPVIYDRGVDEGKAIAHPFFEVNSPALELSDRYVKVGTFTDPEIPTTGEPIVRGQIAFSCQKTSELAANHALSLSTGLSAPTVPLENNRAIIAGAPVPNHILVFRRGACPNCYPNDAGARFENVSPIKEVDDMDEESKGLLKTLIEKIENLGKAPEQKKTEETTMEDPKITEQLTNVQVENATLKVKVEQLTNELATATKLNEALSNKVMDLQFLTLVNTVVPQGWIDTPDKRATEEKEYRDNPGMYALKLARFLNTKPAEKPAEGSKMENVQNAPDGWGMFSMKKKEV